MDEFPGRSGRFERVVRGRAEQAAERDCQVWTFRIASGSALRISRPRRPGEEVTREMTRVKGETTPLQQASQAALDLKALGRRALMEAIAVRFGIPKGGFRNLRNGLYGKNRDVRLIGLIRTLANERQSVAATANLKRASDLVPEVPVSLVLITAAREHDSSVTTRSSRLVNTWYEGGLDFLWQNRNRLGLPSDITKHWRAATPFTSPETGNVVHPGLIPASDEILGYAAQTRLSFSDFETQMIELLGEANGKEALAALTDEARQVWEALAFVVPRGRKFDPSTVGQFTRRDFGVRSALGYLIDKAGKEGRDTSLNEILTDPSLNLSNHVKKAKVRAAEAAFVDELLPRGVPSSVKPKIPSTHPSPQSRPAHGLAPIRTGSDTSPLTGVLGFVGNLLGIQEARTSAAPHFIGEGRKLKKLTREPEVSLGLSHTVARGETISSIARKYGTTVDAIGRANPWLFGREARTRSGKVLRDLDLIRHGETLILAGAPLGGQAIPKDGAGFNVGTANISLSLSHTVARGETISSIARKYGTTVDAIGRANPWLFGREAHTHSGKVLRDLDLVRHGERIHLPF